MTKAAARKRFIDFHGCAPREGEIATVRMDGTADVFVVGEMQGVIYISAGDGKKYIHEFKPNARPVLTVTSDGKQLYALAGAYEFTDRGFEDKPAKRKTGARKK